MSRGRVFASMCSVVFLVNLARVVFAPLLEPLSGAFALTESTAGLIATLAWLGSALPRIPTGYLLTRVDRHRVVLGSGAVLTGAAAFMTVADSVVALGAGAFLMGASSGAYFIAANPLLSELYPAMDTYLLDSLPDENRASAYSLYSGSMMVVGAMGSVVVGTLVDAGFGYDAVFRGFGGLLVAVLAVLVALWSADVLPTGGRDAGVARCD